MKFSQALIPGLASAASGVIGWLLHAGTIDGTTQGTTVGLSSATLIAGMALFSQVRKAWTEAGGKLDGKLTETEFDAVAGTLVEHYAPGFRKLVNPAAPIVVPAVNALIAPKATALIDQLSAWFGDKTPDPNESVLNAKLLDILSDAVKNDPEGSAAAATLRNRLHDALFPKVAPAISIV